MPVPAAPPQPELIKPKRQISDAQREHLNNIRSKALEKKAQMKEETLKAKLAQTLEKKELVKKYDEYAEKEKAAPKPQEKKDPIKTTRGGTPKERKIVYKLAESSSSDSSDEEEVVYIKKLRTRKNIKNKYIRNQKMT